MEDEEQRRSDRGALERVEEAQRGSLALDEEVPVVGDESEVGVAAYQPDGRDGERQEEERGPGVVEPLEKGSA